MKTTLGPTRRRARGQGRTGGRTGGACGAARGGFTLMELMIVVAIIGLLATLAFIVIGKSLRDARTAVERQTVISMRNAVESFKQDFGFPPPLVDDLHAGGPVNNATHNPYIRDDAFLRSGSFPAAQRWSAYSLPYYLFGMLGVEEDGVEGPGFTQPQADGTFLRRGRDYPARLDVSRDPARIKRNPVNKAEVVYVDRWGKAATSSAGWPAENPIRYYRWLPTFGPDGKVLQYLVPRAVGDPNINVALRDAQYAIVSVGPDGATDQGLPVRVTGTPAGPTTSPSPITATSVADDIVEAGR